MREHDRLAACELHPDEARALAALFKNDARVGVHARDGYGAIKALLPPKAHTKGITRGLVLIDPPYESQDAEFDTILASLADALARWPTGIYAVWYPIKQHRTLNRFLRRVAELPCKSAFVVELLVRPDDSPLRLNGSGMLLINPPYQLDAELAPVLPVLARLLGESHADSRLEWIRPEGGARR